MSETDARQRYRRAKAIVTEVIDCPRSGRAALIARRCADDEPLRREVEWLLDAAEDSEDDEVPEDFQQAARNALQEVSFEVPLPRNYRLLKRLGQGGTGIVYLAERVDGELRQPVAFKLLHFDENDNEALAQRFAAERAILSRLNHPGIARLIDGGLTSERRPFLATEFVEGERIDRWAAGERPRNEILERFIRVGEAVDYAHRHMVIHRDIKPANILVTPSGEPRLLDFGVAGLLDDEVEPNGGDSQALTPGYASPEQLRGQGLSAATDVYSLGVVLYELLSGRHPFAESAEGAHLSESVLKGDWPAPDDRHGRRLPADLTAIIERAMHVDEHRRYLSVGALVADLRRFLQHRPVGAFDGGFFYRASCFTRRHRAGLGLGLVAVVLLTAFMINREVQLERIAWERDRAEAVTDFMSGLIAGADALPARGRDVTVREILDMGARRLAASERDHPAALGEMYLALGQAYNALGLGEQALPLLEHARDMLGGRAAPRTVAMIQSEIGAAYDSAGRAAEAIAADEQAISLLERNLDPGSPQVTRAKIRRLRNMANVLDQAPQGIVRQLESIIDRIKAQQAPDQQLLFDARSALVGARVAAGEREAALGDALRVRELAEALYSKEDPRRLRGRYLHATALMLSQPRQAVIMLEELVADHADLVGPSQRMANAIGNLGVALSRLERNEEAMTAFRRAADMIEDTVGRDHYLYRLSMMNLAALRLRVGQPREAERLIQVILPGLEQRHERLGGIETFYWASTLEVLGGAEVAQGRLADAVATYERARDALEAGTGETWPELRKRIVGKLAELEAELSRS